MTAIEFLKGKGIIREEDGSSYILLSHIGNFDIVDLLNEFAAFATLGALSDQIKPGKKA